MRSSQNQNSQIIKTKRRNKPMSDFRVVYLIVEQGRPEQPNFWRVAGTAFVCRDGSLNLKLDLFPNLRVNIREPKSNGERLDAGEPKQTGEQAGTGEPLPEVSPN